ncbi:MAG: cytochrome c3 family protein [bacterium]
MNKKNRVAVCICVGLLFIVCAFTYITVQGECPPHPCLQAGCHCEKIDHPTAQCEGCHTEAKEHLSDPQCRPAQYKIIQRTRQNGINACNKCHSEESLGVSHPVGIIPSKKILLRQDDTSIPLAVTGEILCISCHFPHKRENPDLCRLKGNKELCVRCHGLSY